MINFKSDLFGQLNKIITAPTIAYIQLADSLLSKIELFQISYRTNFYTTKFSPTQLFEVEEDIWFNVISGVQTPLKTISGQKNNLIGSCSTATCQKN